MDTRPRGPFRLRAANPPANNGPNNLCLGQRRQAANKGEFFITNEDDTGLNVEKQFGTSLFDDQSAEAANWKLDQQDAIQGIEGGKWSFYVSARGQIPNVIVAISRYGNKYLKTEADGEQPNNLL